MISRKPSVSKTESTPWTTHIVRSRPRPVSTFCAGSGSSTLPGLQVVLHEDEVVDLHVAVAVPGPARGVAAGVALAAVVEDLRALAARAGLGRLPEVVLAEPHDPLGRDPDALPGRDRDGVLVEREHRVALVDGRPEAVWLELHHLRDELPGIVDRLVLEVVAEREVAEHLEERAVPLGAADVVEVGVLAACAEALSGRSRRGRAAAPWCGGSTA